MTSRLMDRRNRMEIELRRWQLKQLARETLNYTWTHVNEVTIIPPSGLQKAHIGP